MPSNSLMTKIRVLAACAAVAMCALAFQPAPRSASAADAFSDEQKAQIGEIVKDYLIKNPEVIIEIQAALEAKMEKEQADKLKSFMSENAKTIYRNPNSSVAGNPDGDITVVEFFDYNCGYCKRGMPELQKLIENDKRVRVVFKELPILSKGSEEAARAALAAKRQGKYWEFHLALLGHEGKVTRASVDEIAAAQGLDVEKLKEDMKSPEIAKVIAANQQLAQDLNITGTPAFIIDKTVVPGYLPVDGLMAAINEVRATGGCKLC